MALVADLLAHVLVLRAALLAAVLRYLRSHAADPSGGVCLVANF